MVLHEEARVGLGVADDALLDGVPFHAGAPEAGGDVREMADCGGTVADLHGAYGLPPLVHGIDEIMLVASLRVDVVVEVDVGILEIRLLPVLERFRQLQLAARDEEISLFAMELQSVETDSGSSPPG